MTRYSEYQLNVLVIFVVMCALSWCTKIYASQPSILDESYADKFLHYQPRVVPGKQLEQPKPRARVTPSEKQGEQPVTVEWLKNNYPILEQRAIDKPTKENINAYLYAKRIILDKAQRFSNAVTAVNDMNPLLNENNRIPYASVGAESVRRADKQAQQAAVKELSQTGGLMVFIDRSCHFCAMQLPIISMLKKDYGMESLVVSIDGRLPDNYTGKMVKDNGLWKKLGLKLTPSIVFVNTPKSYSNGDDPNKYLIISQGFYAEDELVKQIAFAGFRSNLLSKSTAKTLDIWNIGVSANQDLQNLRLDPNRPETFKQIMDPILMKQYR
ncbi:conjugal transfer protein TraF [Chromobacterium haemolyticum]|uniref:Conjugal transfer protein TraF n=1 Tax=Chromobacterium fluminis TaxID=3044269 RepID=A0ABX0LEE0_9NEIS|nr:conjugal transfer protein TraF [Chromobacterium haemolyticum]NHR07796.1 conjugal transfer protein TraF [Chromobacterium haemolyticum]